jgi:hypothetical protein
MAVDGDIGDVGEKLGGAVLALDLLEQFRRLIDKARRVAAVDEARMADDVFEEGQVGGDATDTELAQRPVHALAGFLGRRCPGGDLFQQRVVETGDHRAGIGRAAIQADAEAGRAAIGGDAAIVGDEVLVGIFGGDAALHGMAVQLDLVLGRDARGRHRRWQAAGDVNLRLDDVDAGDLLGHGVLDLDARIDLDEVEGAGVGIHQELDRAGAAITHVLPILSVAASSWRAGRRQIRGGRALDDLLVAALHGAVALEQMHQIAMGIAEDLHLDMAGALHQLFQIDLILAEGRAPSFLAIGTSRARSFGVRITRMPRPPPPQLALSMTG